MTIWVVRDRRVTSSQISKDIVEGNFNSLYFNADSARGAAFSTDKVWKIDLSVNEEEK
jgi:hypothetical protein